MLFCHSSYCIMCPTLSPFLFTPSLYPHNLLVSHVHVNYIGIVISRVEYCIYFDHAYICPIVLCNMHVKANVSKSVVMVFSKNSVERGWKWGEHKLPKVSN